MEIALPPPRQIVSNPRFPPLLINSLSMVVVIRAPEHPNGCPIATAPPFTLKISSGISNSFWTATDAVGKASLCSYELLNDSALDPDGDGDTNLEEYHRRSNPFVSDKFVTLKLLW